jgi:hypothetical protein
LGRVLDGVEVSLRGAQNPHVACRSRGGRVNELFGDLSTLIKKNVNMKLIPAIEIFKNLSSTEVEVLVDSAKDAIFKAGETVITKGEAKPSVYIIKEGTAMREKEEITTGACFGEEAFLEKGKQYGSTVVAKDNLTCLQIDAHKFGASTTAQMARALEAHNAHRAGSGSKTQRDANKVATMPKKEELTVLNLIGVGSFGRVRLVRHETSSTYYALKCMNKGLVVARKQVTHVNNEKSILARCSHPFLVNLVGWYQDMHELYMLFELMLGGELFSIMAKGIFTADTCRFYSGNVTSAFEYLHERKIACARTAPPPAGTRASLHARPHALTRSGPLVAPAAAQIATSSLRICCWTRRAI